MTTVTLSIFGGVGSQFFDNSGNPLSGGKVYTYAAGTTTPLPTYTSRVGDTPHSNPIVLDSGGRVPGGEIWNSLSLYKFVLKSSTDVTIATFDNVGGSFNAVSLIDEFTGNGVTTAFTLGSSPASKTSTNVYINGVYQHKDTYSLTGAVITFSEAPYDTALVEVSYV